MRTLGQGGGAVRLESLACPSAAVRPTTASLGLQFDLDQFERSLALYVAVTQHRPCDVRYLVPILKMLLGACNGMLCPIRAFMIR